MKADVMKNNDMMSDKVIKLQEDNAGVKGLLKAHQDKIAELMRHLENSNNQFNLYIPKRVDKVDVSLAAFINRYPEKEKLKILFLR